MAHSYYNEHDPKAAAWIRELIAAGEIPDGKVDERSITDVTPDDLVGFTQFHFFAGIGGWARALRLAGWSDKREVVTCSCPCQPFSAAGKGEGTSDERHLWPVFFELARVMRWPLIIGEQVASKAVVGGIRGKARKGDEGAAERVWLDGVFADLEDASYTCAAVDIPAASIGAPHIRQRIYWMAVANGRQSSDRDLQRSRQHGFEPQDGRTCHGLAVSDQHGCAARNGREPETPQQESGNGEPQQRGGAVRLAEPHDAERRPDAAAGHEQHGAAAGRQQGDGESGAGRAADGLADSSGERRERGQDATKQAGRGVTENNGSDREWLGNSTSGGRGIERDAAQPGSGGHAERAGGTGSLWSNFAIIGCRDGKSRRIPRLPQSDVFAGADGLPGSVDGRWIESDGIVWPLAKGIKGRTGLLRGAGNAIQCELAAEFIRGVAGIL